MIIDATCAPADIRYPTDLSLLNEGREKAEKIIDKLHEPFRGKEKKVRTYRQEARKEYLKVAKRRRAKTKIVRKGIRKQLQYLSRNLKYIEELRGREGSGKLSEREYRNLVVIKELYEQQKYMYENKVHSVKGRIVSISQPHVRPIVRGKIASPVEFGAKISVSVVDGYVFLDRLSWENYNESADLKGQVEKYKERHGYYPESVHADKIYRTRENRRYCEGLGIRLSGPPLGRPKKNRDKEKERLVRQDEIDRIAVEGKFGNGKRKYGLGRIMSKRADTSESSIGMIILVMNMEKILKDFLFAILVYAYLQLILKVKQRIRLDNI